MNTTYRYRWFVLAPLLLLIAATNFGDRVVLGVVVPLLVKEFHFTPKELGWILSAFGFGFCAMQCLGSATMVRWRQPRQLIIGMGTLWSIFIGLVAAASSVTSFFIFRALFGLSEGCNWAAFLTLASRWYPRQEIKRAVNFFWISTPLAAMLIPPGAALLAARFSWRVPFVVLGVIGLVLVVVFAALVRDFPEESPRVSEQEKQLIVTERVLQEQHRHRSYKWRTVLTSIGWWPAVGSIVTAYQSYMLIAWLPEYLVRERGLTFIHSGIYAALPFFAGSIGGLLVGTLADAAVQRHRTVLARTVLPGLCVVLAGLTFLSIPFAGSTAQVLMLLGAAAFFGQAANGLFASSTVDVFPYEPHMGTQFIVGAGSLTAIFAPLITGYVLAATGKFIVAFFIGGAPAAIVGSLFILMFRSRAVAPDFVPGMEAQETPRSFAVPRSA